MLKRLHTILNLLTFTGLIAHGQQPVLVVKTFDYIWQKDINGMAPSVAPRVIILSDDSAKVLIKNSFAKAIKDRWNILLPDVSLSVKPLPMLANKPKFNTRLKDKEPGNWYLFLQIFDKGNFPMYSGDGVLLSTILEIRCSLENGGSDSAIINRTLTVNIYSDSMPGDQVRLTRLPAFPRSFLAAFDSIATLLFQPQTVMQTSLTLRPACVFQPIVVKKVPLSRLVFKSDNQIIQHIAAPLFSFSTPMPKYERVDVDKNKVGNTANGVVTLFTGMRTNRRKVFKYRADFPFEEADSVYHCVVNYKEEEISEQSRDREKQNGSKSYSISSTDFGFLGRYPDPVMLSMVILGQDTVATFRISYPKQPVAAIEYKQMWDGIDSSTITAIPAGWNNKEEVTNVEVSGEIDDQPFTMKTSMEMRVKEFYIKDKLMTQLQGSNQPLSGYIFHSISTRQLKLFTILASLPYPYFNQLPSN